MKLNRTFMYLFTMWGSVAFAASLKPKTLLELSNVQRPDVKWDNSILIIVDAQREYVDGRLPLHGIRSAVGSIEKLLLQARQRAVPVIHILHEGTPGGLFDPSGNGFKSISQIAPAQGETVILKHLPNAFAGTQLESEIQKLGKDKNLIFVGFMTHMCISSSARAALDLGFQTSIVKDAVATRDLLGPNGETIPADQINASSLAALQDRVSWVIEAKDLLNQK